MSYSELQKRDSQVSLKSETEASLKSSTTTIPERTDTTALDASPQIDHIQEAMKGNFMPSIILLEKNIIQVNSPINISTGDTLLHLATSFSYYNVTRTLIEKFKANINIQNKNGHTPLHILCYNTTKDLVILNYYLNIPEIDIDIEDGSGLTALSYAVINNFNIAFMSLVSKGADLGHIDKYGNNMIYFALVNNNVFVVNFFYKHCSEIGVSVNTTFYSNTVTLSDILITNKNIQCCQHLMKNFSQVIDCESIVHCCKFITEFPFYNRYNYETINTLLFYKAKDVKGFLNSIFPLLCCCLKKKRRNGNATSTSILISGNQSFRQQIGYNSGTLVNLNNENINTSRRKESEIDIERNYIPTNDDMCYHYKKDNLIMFFYELCLINNKKVLYLLLGIYWVLINSFSLYFLFNNHSIGSITLYTLTQISLLVSFLYLWNCDSNAYEAKKYSFGEKEENILSVMNKAIDSKNIFDFPFENEICEFCLINKKTTTRHCLKCDKCVQNYYFHSDIFNKCIHNKNVRWYILYYFSIFMFHCLLVKDFFNITCYLCMSYFVFAGGILLGKILSLIFCVGYGITYFTAYNYHLENNTMDNIQERRGQFYAIPKMYLIPFSTFMKNLICNWK